METGKKKQIGDYVFLAVVIVLIAGIGVSIKLYMDSQARLLELQNKASSPTEALALEAKQTIDRLAKHLVLPAEEPKVLSIANVEMLRKNQPFFDQANNGDKLIIYADKIILYNPTLDKVVDIARMKFPVETPSIAPTPTAEPTPESSPTPTVRVRRPTATPKT